MIDDPGRTRIWMTVRQAAEYLLVSEKTVRKYIDAGVLKAGRLPSGELRIKIVDVKAILGDS